VRKGHFHLSQGDRYCCVVFENSPRVSAQFPAIAGGELFQDLFLIGGEMNAKTIVTLGLVHALLLGCATPTPEERADQVIARHGPFCDRLGYARGGDSWRNCVVQRERERQSDVVCFPVGGMVMCD
jgi:hypothetical protein